MLEQFDNLFSILNVLDEGMAVNYISHFWDDNLNGWNPELVDEASICILQRDVEAAYSNAIAIQD